MDNSIVEIRPENILFRFHLGDQEYAILGEDIDKVDDDDIVTYFAKINIIDGEQIIRNIESDEEYNRVVSFFDEKMSQLGGEI